MHISRFVFFLCLIMAVRSSAQSPTVSLTSPPSRLTLFAPGIVSTGLNERDFAISPDGREIYFTVSTPRSSIQTLVSCRRLKDDTWSKPEVVSFAGHFSDLEPAFSADGNTLYFASNRPLSGETPKDFDIWKVTRTGKDWGTPVNLGAPINTDADEFYPSVTKLGNLYYTAAYAGGIGKEDIYVASLVNGEYQNPVQLDTAVNSKAYEFNAFVTPDEQYIFFTSAGRKDDMGGGDLYVSRKGPDGRWMPAQNMREINSRQIDYCPYVSPDGKSFFMTSNRHQLPVAFPNTVLTYDRIQEIAGAPLNGNGDIYWIDFQWLISRLAND
jgi:Tol biopolymer transport system component